MTRPIVYLVDDDYAVRDSLAMLLRSVDLDVCLFDSAQSFLDGFNEEELMEGCLVLDVRMPGVSGFAVQERITNVGSQIPIIFITGHGDIEQCRKAFRMGAVDFLSKPVDEQTLLDSLQKAIELSRAKLSVRVRQDALRQQFSLLTERERQVCERIIVGLPNKMIAAELDISLRTVEVHRANLLSKLGVDSVANLVKLSLESGIFARKGDVNT
ncbi:response regulator [Crenobacter sp. SG2303]|uniref:Response regulator n=1 Tax=Crenobacter oryzisoli TaxID=3056844 RepID=A0ABT7XUN4_9NEIS|nr:response regulator [Crenobacter sp. SG2303]MDN0077508.1 response regulator [Crenobacter sp. SG2303]